MTASISGTISYRNRRRVSGANVQLFQVGWQSTTFLGEAPTDRSGSYRINYTLDETRRLNREGRAAPSPVNLQVRVFDRSGQPMGASEIHFGAGPEETIDATVDAPDQTRLSEWERIQARVAAETGSAEVAGLTDEQLAFVSRAIGVDRDRLDLMRQADAIARATNLSETGIFAALRQGLQTEDDGLFDDPDAFAQAVARAIDARIVPESSGRSLSADKARLDRLLQHRAARRRERFTPHQVVGRLVNADTGETLAGYSVASTDRTNREDALGYDVSDAEGLFGIRVDLPPDAGESERRRTIELRVADPQGQDIHRENVAVVVDTDKLVTLKVPVATPRTVSPGIGDLDIELPDALAQTLEQENIRTLADIRGLGGLASWLGGQATPPVPPSTEAVRLLDAHAQLDTVSGDVGINRALVAAGITDPVAMAAVPRSRVVEQAHERLGDVKAMEMFVKGRAHAKLLSNMAVQIGLESVNGVDTASLLKGPGVRIGAPRCGCEDCESAVSPLAYLADLLDYTIDHIENDGKPVGLQFLTAQFHQPFGALPANCDEMENKVRQVRIGIEVLRRYLAAQNLPAAGSGAAEALEAAERAYALAAYTTLLGQLGTSYDELRLARTAEDETRATLAERLGIGLSENRPDQLDALFLDPDADPPAIDEAILENLFGLVDTNRNPLADGPETLLLTWRRAHLETLWHRQDWPENPTEDLPPHIDPDLIGPADLVDPQPGNPAFDLWQSRRQWVDQHLQALESQREAAASEVDGLDAIVDQTFPSADIQQLLDYEQQHAEGEDITSKLEALALPLEALRRLLRIRALAAGENPVLAAEWGEAYSILTQVHKQAQFEAWRQEEMQADILLGPEHFKRRDPSPLTFPPQPPPPLPEWRANTRARQNWEDRLTARIEQKQSLVEGLATAVHDSEETVLPRLREALIEAATQRVYGSSAARAKWLGDRLLIDLQADGCQQTTRISQAIETVQGLLWSVRNRLMNDTHPDLDLNDDDFDEVWQWLGSYATWRTAMFVFLYPENILVPHLRRQQTPAFRRLVSELRKDRRLSPARARRAVDNYAAYFNDITDLKPEASCQTRARIFEDGQAIGEAYKFFVFARGRHGRTIYWSAYNPEDQTGFAQSFWQVVPGTGEVIAVVGALPFKNISGHRHIYLFLQTLQKGQAKLVFVRYDLENARWEGEATELELPDDDHELKTALVRHTFRENLPPQLVVKMGDGALFVRRLGKSGDDWEDAEWRLLLGAARGKSLDLKAFIEFEKNNAALVVKENKTIRFRFFGSCDADNKAPWAAEGQYNMPGDYDDGQWHGIVAGDYIGAFALPDSGTFYVFYRFGSLVRYAVIAPGNDWGDPKEIGFTKDDEASRHKASRKLNRWFIDAAGANLSQISPDSGAYVDINLLTMFTSNDWTGISGLFEKIVVDAVRTFYSRWLVRKALKAEYTDRELGPWRLAHWQAVAHGKPHGKLRLDLHEAIDFEANPLQFRQRKPDIQFFNFYSGIDNILPIAGNAGTAIDDRQFCYLWGSGGRGLYRCRLKTFTSDSSKLSRPLAPVRMAPRLTKDVEFKETMSEKALQKLRLFTSKKLKAHQNDPASNLTYLEEAFYFLPVQTGLMLQRRGHYTAALDWLRRVYDHSMPAGQRKIYYGLEEAWSGPFSFQRAPDWLQDPLNPHAIAGSRQNTYTRFTLLTIIRCLLDYADAEFTRDTVESVPRARLLYQTVLELLEVPLLRQSTRWCADVIGSLNIRIGDHSWAALLGNLKQEMARITDSAALKKLVEAVAKELDGQGDWPLRFARARELISEAAAADQAPRSVAQALGEGRRAMATAVAALESDARLAALARRTATRAARDFRGALSVATGIKRRALASGKFDMPVLRKKLRASGEAGGSSGLTAIDPKHLRQDHQNLARYNRLSPSRTAQLARNARGNLVKAVAAAAKLRPTYVPSPSFAFCIPANPVLKALRLKAEASLYKLRTCRNIAGMQRELEPYAAPTDTVSGMPVIGAGGQLVLPGLDVLKPTPYRYPVLIERAKQLAGLAQQMESALLAAIEKGDAERYGLLKARQDVQMARGGIRLQRLRVKEARNGVKLAELQKARAQIEASTYQRWLDEGMLETESIAITRTLAAAAHHASAGLRELMTLFSGGRPDTSFAAMHSSIAQALNLQSSIELRMRQWELQKSIADQDVRIGAQQVKLAEDHVRVVEQERVIAEMQLEHAREVVDFLANKFTNVELYDWMSNVLEGIYAYFLQEATALAQVAAGQLAFERQETPPPFIQSDYWEAPADFFGGGDEGQTPDRRGLTGSARLLQDIHQLDQFAFDTDRRKLQLTKTISLAEIAPVEFQRFRETGVLLFATPMELFDRDFPGHYLRLIKRVRTSVIALIPPIHGLHATLSTTGTSRVVVGGDFFQELIVNHGPQSVALTSPREATGLFELDAKPEMLLPFEGLGVDTSWELRMPKASNRFDYTTIADVLLTIEYTALDSFDYRQQLIPQLDNRVSADRPFSFRHQMADQWYHLHNPGQSKTPMTVTFRTRREDFPPHIENIKIQHVVLYFGHAPGSTLEMPITHLHFYADEAQSTAPAGGEAATIDGIASTRRGNTPAWSGLQGKKPFGRWELALPDTPEVRAHFENEEIEEILFVITYQGRTADWPA